MVTVPTTILEGPIATLREKAIEILEDIAGTLAEEGENTQSDVKRLRDVAHDLRDMFFIVSIIGEFNAGKSSFVNALIGERLLPIGITPTTEYIELIRYNDTAQRNPIVKDNALREWGHPNTGAPGVAIVDTPGTGSVFQKHEEIAKQFLHRSDLVIFLISAKHAFAETERLYLELAQKYDKKIILVVNQIDLLNVGERQEVQRFIQNQVKETLNIDPLIFMVSAKEALAAIDIHTTEDPGNIAAIKAHLRGVYSETPPARQKLLAQLDTAARVVQDYQRQAKQKKDLISADITKVNDVRDELEQQSLGLQTRMQESGNEIDRVLESIRKRGINFIDTNLTIRKLGRKVNKEKLQQEFEEIVIGRSLRDINESTNDYINAVVDQSRLYWRGVIDRLNRLRDLMDNEASGLDSTIYAEQRANLQDAIRIAESELKSYSSGEVVSEMKQSFDTNMGGFQLSALTSLGGIAAIIAAVAMHGPLIGVGAAPLALPVFLVGGAVALVAGIPAVQYIRKLSRETKTSFNTRVDTLIKNYHTALGEITQKERNRLNQYGHQVLMPVFSRLEVMSKRYQDQQQKLERYEKQIADLRQRIVELT